LTNRDGKQLLPEAMALFGQILLSIDTTFDYEVKERIVVAYYRCKKIAYDAGDGTAYSYDATLAQFEDVVKLTERTKYGASLSSSISSWLGSSTLTSSSSGSSNNSNNSNNSNSDSTLESNFPSGYPHDTYFSRFPMPKRALSLVIGKLRSDDIYNCCSEYYPDPDHRSMALSQQASLLVSILWFSPETLTDKPEVMREIVEKHFADNWIVNWTYGKTMDLRIAWKRCEAANEALNIALNGKNVQKLCERCDRKFNEISKVFGSFFAKRKIVDEKFVLDNESLILDSLRDANNWLRWCLLHNVSKNTDLSSSFSYYAPKMERQMELLLDVAEIERVTKLTYSKLLKDKNTRWENARNEASSRISELSRYFGGSETLTKFFEKKDENLTHWFAHIAEQIEQLEHTQPSKTIQQLSSALLEVDSFHSINTNLQAKTYIAEARQFLDVMLKTASVGEKTLNTITAVSDASYAWSVKDSIREALRSRVQQDPFACSKVRSLLLKLRSVLEMPLMRISSDERSEDVDACSKFYSKEIASYASTILTVIPESVFKILDEKVASLRTSELTNLPATIEKRELIEYAKLETREELAQTTHNIAAFARGILAMEKTFVGVIELDPRKLLEDGIREQLARRLAKLFDEECRFEGHDRDSARVFKEKLISCVERLDAFKSAFEYIQDYVNVRGLKAWREELARVNQFCVERERRALGSPSVGGNAGTTSMPHAVSFGIPLFPPTKYEPDSQTYMGRIVRKLIQLTSQPKYIDETMIFLPNRFAWVDFMKTDRQKLSLSTFKIMNKAIGVSGLRAMDDLLTNIVAQSLRECVAGAFVAKTLVRVGQGGREGSRLPNLDEAFVKNFCKDLHGIGACLLLRTFVNTELNSSAKIDSGTLVKAIENVNDATLCDETQHALDAKLSPSQSKFYEELSDKLKSIGFQTPLLQTYVKIDELDAQKINVADVLFVFLEKYVFPNVEYSEDLKILVASEVSGRSLFRYDVSAIIVGIASLCAQFNGSKTLTQHIASIGLEIKSKIAAIATKRREEKLSRYANVKPPKPGSRIVSTPKNTTQKGNLERTYAFPDDVRKLVAYLETLSYFANVEREVLESFVPSYVLHNAHSYVDLSF
jgi:WASH complex subunit strumpellin